MHIISNLQEAFLCTLINMRNLVLYFLKVVFPKQLAAISQQRKRSREKKREKWSFMTMISWRN